MPLASNRNVGQQSDLFFGFKNLILELMRLPKQEAKALLTKSSLVLQKLDLSISKKEIHESHSSETSEFENNKIVSKMLIFATFWNTIVSHFMLHFYFPPIYALVYVKITFFSIQTLLLGIENMVWSILSNILVSPKIIQADIRLLHHMHFMGYVIISIYNILMKQKTKSSPISAQHFQHLGSFQFQLLLSQ